MLQLRSSLDRAIDDRKFTLSMLTDQVNIVLLCMLKAGPSYPRRLSQLMGINESHISERLKKLKKAGFLNAKWARIEASNGYINVRQYSLKSDKIVISFTSNGVEVKTGEGEHERVGIAIPYYNSEMPKISSFVGRVADLEFLHNTPGIKVIWGIPGIGKTSLVSMYASRSTVPVFWHEVKQVDSLSYVLTKLAVFLNLQGRSGLLDLINSGIGDRRALLETAVNEMSKSSAVYIFDDFHRCMDRGIHELLQSMAECGINGTVITRHKLPFPNSQDLKIEGLPAEESAELMKALGHRAIAGNNRQDTRPSASH
ncbi:MAG: AAA family ATPase [Nitrososphaeria archaeon]